MHVLMTGATGFVGRALCRRLVEDGHQVTAVSRSPETALQRLPGAAAAISWDDLSVAGSLSGMDAVVHLAGETVTGRWNEEKHRRVRESRIEGTRAVVGAIKAADPAPSVLVAASGIGFYGEGGEEELSESAPPGDDFFAKLCVDWEAETALAETAECRVVQARLGIVLGEGGGAIGAMLRPARLGLGGPLGTGRQWWSWIHLEDAAAALRHALITETLSGPINVVAPQPVRQGDFARALGRVLGRPSVLPAPAFALRLVLGTFAAEVLSSKRVRADRLRETGFVHQYAELSHALEQALGAPQHHSVWFPVIASATLGLAPYSPEPHILGKLRWVAGGANQMVATDWLDLAMHGAPWVWLAAAVALRLGGAAFARGP